MFEERMVTQTCTNTGAQYIQRENSSIFKHSLMAGTMWLFDIYSEMHKKHLSVG